MYVVEYQSVIVFSHDKMFSNEKVNVSRTKSTDLGKETTKAGKQTTGSEGQVNRISIINSNDFHFQI